jgi:predicted nuclease of predicted toxin-antitoxin system
VKFKLDENLGTRTQQLFRAAGHETATVGSQRLCGTPDTHLYEVCRLEGRCLVTLDTDFADIRRFPPQDAAGVVVLRLPRNPTLPVIESLVSTFLGAIDERPLAGRLWLVEPGRIRVHQTDSELGYPY